MPPAHFFESIEGEFGHPLVAPDVADAHIVAECDEIVGVGGVGVAGVELDEALRGNHCRVVVAVAVMRVGGHQLRPGRPRR